MRFSPRSRRLRLGLVVALAALARIHPAEASDTPAATEKASQARVDEAKARYERGAQAYAAGRFKDAIDLFLQADAMAPSAALSFNIARAYEKIGDDAACLQWYRDFRRRAPQAPNGADVDRRIGQLEAALAAKGVQQLSVFSSPSGATVAIDGRPLGVTPYTGQLTPGKHTVTLTLKGHDDAEQLVELGAEHAQDVQLTLRAAEPGQPASAVALASTQAGKSVDTPAPPPGPRFGAWPYVVIGAGGAALAGALAFELARRSAEDAAEQDPTQVGYQEKLEKMQRHQTTARVLLGTGGALLAAGGTLLVLDLTSRPSAPSHAALGWACSTDGCDMNLRGRF